MQSWTAFVLLICLSSSLLAQPPIPQAELHHRFTHLTETDGLADNHVWAAI